MNKNIDNFDYVNKNDLDIEGCYDYISYMDDNDFYCHLINNGNSYKNYNYYDYL